MRSSFFWDVTQLWLVITDVSGQPVGPIFNGQATQEEYLTLEIRPIVCPETSATNYQFTLRNVTEELRSHNAAEAWIHAWYIFFKGSLITKSSPVIKRTVSRIDSLDTSMMVNSVPVIRQYIRRLYKRTGLVAIHSPAVGSRSCDFTFHSADLMTLEFTLIMLTWRIWWASNNASRWQIGFNSVFKGLNT